MYEFSNVSDDLMLFFHIKDHGKCFFSENYFEPFKEKLTEEYDFNFLQSLLLDDNEIIKRIFKYYFHDVKNEDVDYILRDMSKLGKIINESSYDEIIKSKLYYFFISPALVIQKLRYELLSINTLLSQYYEKNNKRIIEFQNDFDINELNINFKKIKTQNYNIEDFENLYFSICLINKNCLKEILTNTSSLIMFGSDYKSIFSYLENKIMPVILDEIGNVLSEKNRIAILDIILKKEEISIRDLEDDLKLSGTNAYYHITMMLKSNMLKSRNEGKIVLYSINKDHFDKIINKLKKYSNI